MTKASIKSGIMPDEIPCLVSKCVIQNITDKAEHRSNPDHNGEDNRQTMREFARSIHALSSDSASTAHPTIRNSSAVTGLLKSRLVTAHKIKYAAMPPHKSTPLGNSAAPADEDAYLLPPESLP